MSIFGGPPGSKVRRVWSWQRWVDYFRNNARTLLAVSWERGAELALEERAALVSSLRQMQQGEGLEGRHFFQCVRAYAERTTQGDYVEAHRLFMAEEKRHAADLGRWLELAGVPLLKDESWLSRLFRWCGSRGGLEQTLVVILMVEVCSQTYYAAVRRASGSRVLRQICSQIQHDEVFHVRFQCEVLARLRRGRPGWLLGLTHLLDGLLFRCAGLVCWWGHRRALRAAGQTLAGFWRQLRLHLNRVWRLKDPGSYAWDGEAVNPVVQAARRPTQARSASEGCSLACASGLCGPASRLHHGPGRKEVVT